MRNQTLKSKIFLILSCGVASVFSISNFALAYTETTSGGLLSAKMYPRNPGPFADVTIQLDSYKVDIDLERSNVIWFMNGKKEKEGIGETNLKFTTGPVGKKMTINVEAISEDGANVMADIKKEISFVPADVDILWQSDGYVPPFYKGKSLAAIGTNVKLVAMPDFISENGTRLNPSSLIYKWRGSVGDLPSGYGKNSVLVPVGDSSDKNISVEISSLDNSLQATKTLTIKPSDPLVILYKSNPLSGTIYNQSLINSFLMNEAETTIMAVPYFLNPNNLTYAWGINDEPLESSRDNSNELTVRQPAGGSGEAILNLLVRSPYQSIQKSVKIMFGKNTGF